MTAKWLKTYEPVQLVLLLGPPPARVGMAQDLVTVRAVTTTSDGGRGGWERPSAPTSGADANINRTACL